MAAPVPPPLPPLSDTRRLCPMISRESFLCRRCSNDEGSPQVEASKVCQRFLSSKNLNNGEKILISFYKRALPVLQEGPSCGLAALCMAGQLIKDPRFISLCDAIETAQARNYTCRGEMFSASNMCNLAAELLDCEVCLLQEGFGQRNKIISHLLRGLPVLVPYDADLNHEPCRRQGHKAHWAILSGILFEASKSADLPWNMLPCDTSLPWLFHADTNNSFKVDHSAFGRISEQATIAADVYVYAKQGKSCHTQLWNLELLALSNANLHELCPRRRDGVHQYIIPEDGVRGGLCQQVILVDVSYS